MYRQSTIYLAKNDLPFFTRININGHFAFSRNNYLRSSKV